MMKVSELRNRLNQLAMKSDEYEALNEALQRFDSMSIFQFVTLLKKTKIPPAAPEEVIAVLEALKQEPNKFDETLEKIGRQRSCTKANLQEIYASLFNSNRKLPIKLKKTEMIDRIKRQRRRDANFVSA